MPLLESPFAMQPHESSLNAASRALFGGGQSSADELLSRLQAATPSTSRYAFEEEIARGGMGAIYRVYDEALKRELAMKVMLGPRSGSVTPVGSPAGTPVGSPVGSPGAGAIERRFIEEARITGQLNHPGIVPLHELGLDAQGRLFFTMRLIHGDTFADVIAWIARGERVFTLARALHVLINVCDAMAYAHSRGIVHRDLKPANIMVGRFGETYVMDWGLARVVAAATSEPG